VHDGTDVGGMPSSLMSMLNSQAPTATWEAEILRAFQTWAVNSNVNIGVVPDIGQLPIGASGAVQSDPRFGDIRIAAKPLAPGTVATTSPFSWSGTTWSGDMIFNSLYSFGMNGQGQYDLYTVALHEAGHVFGIPDTTTDTQSIMYAAYQGPRTGLGSEDIAALQALSGAPATAAAANNSFSRATSLGTMFLNAASVQGSLNAPQQMDYYKFNTPLGLPLLTSINVGVETEGLSLLEPTLSVYNSAHRLIGKVSANNPVNGDVSFTINGLSLFSTYYFTVSAAPNSGIFGTGAYQATVSYNVLPILGYTGLTGVVNNLLNHTLQSALSLPRAFGNNTDQRFDYLQKASIAIPGQQDYYQVQSPNAPAGSTFVLHALVWALDVNGLNPVIHVYDVNANPLPVQVLGNMGGVYSIQIAGAAANSSYTIEVAGQNASGSNSTGNYELGVKFSQNAPVSLALLASSTLASSSSTQTDTLTMSGAGLFHFELAADNGSSSATAEVTMTVQDSQGNVILTLNSFTGQPPATAVVYLETGSYTITYSVTSSSGVFAPVNYWLFGEVLSDPMGAYQVNNTNSSTGSSSGGATGYSYGGSSSTNTSGASPPRTY
jgi:hypothetical protein